VYVCLLTYLKNHTTEFHPKLLMHVDSGLGSLLFRWCCDTLCILVLWMASCFRICSMIKKVKFSCTRYRALGLELIQTVSPQLALSHPPSSRLPLLSARFVVTFPTEEHHRPTASTKLYCLVTEAHWCEQFAQGCYSTTRQPGLELVTTESLLH